MRSFAIPVKCPSLKFLWCCSIAEYMSRNSTSVPSWNDTCKVKFIYLSINHQGLYSNVDDQYLNDLAQIRVSLNVSPGSKNPGSKNFRSQRTISVNRPFSQAARGPKERRWCIFLQHSKKSVDTKWELTITLCRNKKLPDLSRKQSWCSHTLRGHNCFAEQLFILLETFPITASKQLWIPI